MAALIGLLASEVLSTFPSPTIALVIPATVPVKVGEFKGALAARLVVISEAFDLRSNALCMAVLIGLLASEVLSTFPSPTIALVIPDTVPVKVGEFKFALSPKSLVRSEVFALRSSAV